MDPSQTELEVLISVGLAASWAQLPEAAQASLFSYLNVVADEHPRVVAALVRVDEVLDMWTLDGQYPSPALRAKAGLMVRACRVACGLP
eukprot:19920-Amphidinium_carterae.1